jgi:hypothetical protein
MIKLMTLAMTLAMNLALSMPLTAATADLIDQQLALSCTKNLFLKSSDGALVGYPGIAYPSAWQQGTGVYTYEPRYDVSQAKLGKKNDLCAKYYGFIRPSQVSGSGKQANCSTHITGIKVLLNGEPELALNDHQQFVCYFKGRSYAFHSAWTNEQLRP